MNRMPDQDPADERERLAVERECEADERQRMADEREREADERQTRADLREGQLDQQARGLHAAVPSRAQRDLEAIGRTREALTASGHRLDRSEAALRRAAARIGRDQADIDRSSAQSARGMQKQPADPAQYIERAAILRERIADTARALAYTHEEIARAFNELAARSPGDTAEYRRAADDALRAAEHARETEQDYGS